MKSKSLLFGIFALAALTACTNDENSSTGSDRQAASFTADIGTRAYDSTWEENDKIGIFASSGEVDYRNVAYTTINADGNFTPVTEDGKIYYQDDHRTQFMVYYPWNDVSVTDGGITIKADTRQQALQKQFDFLYALAEGSKASPEVQLDFVHEMAKLVLTVKKGTGVTYEEMKSAVLSLQGFKNEGYMKMGLTDGLYYYEIWATGELCPDYVFAGNTEHEAYNAPRTANDTEETLTFSLILFEQAFDAKPAITATLPGGQTLKAELDFTQANTNAGDRWPENKWNRGRQYNMSITLNKTSLQLGDCTIQDWTSVDGGEVDAH